MREFLGLGITAVLLAACWSWEVPNAGNGGGTAASGSSKASGGTGGAGASGGANTGGSGGMDPDDAPTTVHDYTASDAVIANPERGFYRTADIVNAQNLDQLRGQTTLVHSNVRLDAFRSADLSSEIQTKIRGGLDKVRAAGLKLIVRFTYNDGPYPDTEPDASKSRILRHIEQLEPILRDHGDVLAVAEAGFIGAWGGWSNSTNNLLANPQDRRDILDRLLAALPPERTVMLRYPPYKKEMYGGPLDGAHAFDGSSAARVGHHNDCYLGSDNDVGTYPDPIETWKQFVADDTRFVVMGGETCALNPPRSACASALAEFERMHYSFVNHDYHPDVVAGWAQGGCSTTIEKKLGYRLELVSAALPDSIRPGGSFRLEMTLRNSGWAAPFNARPVVVVLRSASRRERAALAGVDDADVRRWSPGDHSISARVRLPADLEPGPYTLALALPDAAPALADRREYAIELANEGTWSDTEADNVLGTITVGANAPGGVDPGATALAVIP